MKILKINHSLKHLRRFKIDVEYEGKKKKKVTDKLILYTCRKGDEKEWEFHDDEYTKSCLKFLGKHNMEVFLDEKTGKIKIN